MALLVMLGLVAVIVGPAVIARSRGWGNEPNRDMVRCRCGFWNPRSSSRCGWCERD